MMMTMKTLSLNDVRSNDDYHKDPLTSPSDVRSNDDYHEDPVTCPSDVIDVMMITMRTLLPLLAM